MLTKNEENYLRKIDPTRTVSIYPFDPSIKELGDSIVKDIRTEISDAEVLFMGSVALEIAGQKDIDIYIIAEPKDFHMYIPSLEKLFGTIDKKGQYVRKTFIEWKKKVNETEIEIYLTQRPERQIRVYEILKSNKNLLTEYEEIKLSFNGKSYKDYMRAKYEFYNRILSSG